MWEKEKMLVTSIFSFSLIVFYSMAIIMTLWKGNSNSIHELFIFKILLIAIDWNF